MNDQPEATPRILVADDDHAIRQLICTIVRREQVAVDGVEDGIAAIEHLEQHAYSIILLDLMMPRLDGFGVIAHLAAHPPEIKPIVIVMSAYSDQRFREVDPDVVAGVFRKPFDVSELSNVVRFCLQGSDQVPARLFYSREKALHELASENSQRNPSVVSYKM